MVAPSGECLRVKAGVVCLQRESCVIHTWVLQRRASHNGAQSSFLYLYSATKQSYEYDDSDNRKTHRGSKAGVRSPLKQQLYHIFVSFLGSDVQRSVQLYSCSIWHGSVLQQQHCAVNGAETRGYVQRGLLLLQNHHHHHHHHHVLYLKNKLTDAT